MEKKYYDIIVSLVKQNDKFLGCESILDDIVQDVYEHSKVVLGSVTNEDVISAYLNKVVSTSLITVPKKLNFNTRHKQRTISNVKAITNISIRKEPLIEESVLEERTEDGLINQEEEPTTNNIAESVSLDETPLIQVSENIPFEETPLVEEEPIIETTELAASEEYIEKDTEIETLEELPFTGKFKTEKLEIEQEPLEEFSEQEVAKEPLVSEFSDASVSEENVDKALVDKMINGVSLKNQEEIQPIDTEAAEDGFLNTEEPDFAQGDFLLEENEVTLDDSENNVQELELTENSHLELEFHEQESLEENSFKELDTFELSEEPLIEENRAEEEDNETSIELPNFQCFSFEPEKPEFNDNEICADLIKLDSKHPEKKLLQICKLKYEEKRSISEIAEILDFSEETVLDTLNDIIEIVKD